MLITEEGLRQIINLKMRILLLHRLYIFTKFSESVGKVIGEH